LLGISQRYSNKGETELDHIKLLVQIPKPLIDFINAYLKFCGICESAEEYLRHELEWHVKVFVKNLVVVNLENSESIMEHYGLKKLLKDVSTESLEV